jgi:hypothetical protein
MSAVLVRVLVAIFAVIIVFLLIPPVFRILGLAEALAGDVLLILKIVIGALALIYIWRGPTLPWRPAP